MSGFVIEVIDGDEQAVIEVRAGSDIDFSRDWSKWLVSAGNVNIAGAAVWSCDDADIAFHDAQVVAAVTSVYISGVKAAKEYWIDCKITTNKAPPQIETKSFLIRGKAHISI